MSVLYFLKNGLTFAGQNVIIIMPGKKRGEKMSEKKKGRPTNNPRPNKLSIRINDKSKEILENYCEEYAVNKTEAIERGIKMLEKDIKK